jgi:hypothetical protein
MPKIRGTNGRYQGGQPGNSNRLRHGVYSVLAMRAKGGRPNGNTKLGRAYRAREREYLADMGGEENTSLAERQLVSDSTWCDFVLATIDYQLQDKTRLTKKDRPHPLIDLRMRVAAHRRDNYKLLGTKRVSKQVSLEDYIAEKYGSKNDEPEEP